MKFSTPTDRGLSAPVSLSFLSSLALVGLMVAACGPAEGDPEDGGGNNGSGLPGGDGDGGIVVPGPGGDGDGGGGTPSPSAVNGVSIGGWSGECGVLPVTFRDFRGFGADGGTNPDFEISASYPAGANNWRSDKYGTPQGTQAYMGVNEAGCDLISATLDENLKPIFNDGLGRFRTLDPAAWSPTVPQVVTGCADDFGWPWDWTPPDVINGAETFNQWYNDVPEVNQKILGDLTLVDGVFESAAFFPLDNAGFGNTAGQTHNYHFTTESHVEFTYEAGQEFTFRGDDDLWIFVNGALALDLGGLHQPLTGTIVFDNLGLTPGVSYRMDIFHAERQTFESNFRVETNIECFEAVNVR